MAAGTMTRAVALAVAVSAAALAGCEGGDGDGGPRPLVPLVTFDTVPAGVLSGGDTIVITAEVANDDDRRAYGLMERDSLPPAHGMLFVYPEDRPGEDPFWMYRTRIPLDIAFLDAAGVIVAILGMEPCTSPNPELCRRYPPGVGYRGALEMPRGWFAERGVEVGDTVEPAPAEVPSS